MRLVDRELTLLAKYLTSLGEYHDFSLVNHRKWKQCVEYLP